MINTDLSVKLYQSISEDNETRIFKNWHASSMAECPRSHYFKRMGVAPINIPTAAKMLRWQAGHLIEEVIRPHLLKLYPDLKSNVRLTSKKLDLTGEYDNYSEKEKTIFEVKSVHVFAPPKIEKSGKPYLSHEYQNHSYKLLMDEEKLPLEHVTYIYIALDGRITVINSDIQESILNNLTKRLEILRDALEGKLPPCFCKEDHPLWASTTQYCDYQTATDCCNPKLLKSTKGVTEDISLPAKYSKLTPDRKRTVRERYIGLQEGKCFYCKENLSAEPPKSVTDKKIDWSKFPKGFLDYPLHLQHNHDTDDTEGTVHAYCNAVMWQYEGK